MSIEQPMPAGFVFRNLESIIQPTLAGLGASSKKNAGSGGMLHGVKKGGIEKSSAHKAYTAKKIEAAIRKVQEGSTGGGEPKGESLLQQMVDAGQVNVLTGAEDGGGSECSGIVCFKSLVPATK